MTAYSTKRSATGVARPGVAATLSFFVPGLGLLYCGRTVAGLALLLVLIPALVALLIYANGFGRIGLLAGVAVVLAADVAQVVFTRRVAERMARHV